MRIGELAERSGLTQSRIRFYERIGLLKTVGRRSNGYRAYPPEAALILRLIATAQSAGFNLEEIRTLVPPDLAQWEHGALLSLLRSKVKEIEALEARLAESRAQLTALITDIETKPDDISCAANAQRVLSRMYRDEKGAPPTSASSNQRIGKARRRSPVKFA